MSERMIFCLGDGQYETKGEGYQKNYRVFNKDVDQKEWEEIRLLLSGVKISMLWWVDKKDMTDEEKENNSVYKEIGGYLKRISYEEAWSNWWNKATDTEKNKILGIKYFDKSIFKGITGIDTNSKKSELLKKADELIAKAEELKKEAEKV